MKSLLRVVFFTFMLNAAIAQEKHFVFIQSDNKLPFNVSINGKVYSSTASGYVIIPKLADGEYTATIGFAANTHPEQSFKYVINKKDLGFNLKNFGDKGWGLFNLQTLAVTMAGNQNSTDVARVFDEPLKEEYKPEISFDKKKESSVTNTEEKLVTDDASINSDKAKSTAANTPSASINAEAEKQQTTEVITQGQKTTLTGDNNTNAPTASSNALNKSTVKKVAEVKGSMGVYLTYVDENSRDTVQLIIPTAGKKKGSEDEKVSADQIVSSTETKASKRASKKEAVSGNEVVLNNETKGSKRASKKEVASGGQVVSSTETDTFKTSAGNDLQFLDMETNRTKKDSVAFKTSSTAKITPTAGNVQPVQNSNCTNLATDQEVAKLKRKMAQETTDEKIINEAKKMFKNRCFTTSQVKSLSTLFLSDEGRYKFFDASYNYVTDTQVYFSLEKEFIDPAFVTRFKAMLRK